MLDERTKVMLEVANTLTAEDLDMLRPMAPVERPEHAENAASLRSPAPGASAQAELSKSTRRAEHSPDTGISRGERERKRTRASKVSTASIGQERLKHEWWPVGAEVIGHIGSETFDAQVVENPQVKSGRSLLITSGAAQGKVCTTPTRAALEATEAYRNNCNLGRSGGVTNGWSFWKPISR